MIYTFVAGSGATAPLSAERSFFFAAIGISGAIVFSCDCRDGWWSKVMEQKKWSGSSSLCCRPELGVNTESHEVTSYKLGMGVK